MIQFLQWLFVGHCHKWTTLKWQTLTVSGAGGYEATGLRAIQHCERCGKVQRRDLI